MVRWKSKNIHKKVRKKLCDTERIKKNGQDCGIDSMLQ